MKKRRILISIILVLLIILFTPLSWVGVSGTSFRFLFDSDINLRLAANQSWIPTHVEELSERSEHIVRAKVINRFENNHLFIGDTFQPFSMQILYTIRIIEVYQTYDRYGAGDRIVSVGDYIDFQQFIPLHGRNLAGRLTPRATQVRLPLAVDDELILFLTSNHGMGRSMYGLVNLVNAVYYYQLEDGRFVSVNPHNSLVLTPEDLLGLQEMETKETIYEH